MRLAMILLVIVSLAPVAGAGQSAGTRDGRLQCSAFAVSTGGLYSRPIADRLDIVVDRWSTESERRRLVEALKKGQDTLLDTLQDLPRLGYIRTPTSLGWDLHYAVETAGEEGGRRLVIATDRPISIWEAANRPRTIDYPFTFIELRLDNENEGQGKLSLFTRVIATSDGRYVQLENYDTQPVQLNEVTCR
jgi:hypothetical protein